MRKTERESAVHEAALSAVGFHMRTCEELIEAMPIETEMQLRAIQLARNEYRFMLRMWDRVIAGSYKRVDMSNVVDLSKSSHHNITFGKR